MYVRTTTRRNKSGEVTYIQLARNRWDPRTKRSVPTVVATIGRTDRDGLDQLESLVRSATKFLEQVRRDPGLSDLQY